MTLEQLKKQADFIELKLQIYGDQFGPSSDVAEQLKKELKNANMMILELMVQDQSERLNKATIV